jgi:nicotinamide riboside transporter PnuC
MNSFGIFGNLLDLFFVIIGKTGKVLSARGNRICWILDICCLLYWIYIDIVRGLYVQAFSAVVSIGIAIYGFKRWGTKGNPR